MAGKITVPKFVVAPDANGGVEFAPSTTTRTLSWPATNKESFLAILLMRVTAQKAVTTEESVGDGDEIFIFVGLWGDRGRFPF
jgi:hypothetical protein